MSGQPTTRLFMHHIAEVAREQIHGDVATAKFLSIISDGSTDSAAREAEMINAAMHIGGLFLWTLLGM